MFFVFRVHLALIIAREPIHKGHAFKTACIVDHDLSDEEREFILGHAFIRS